VIGQFVDAWEPVVDGVVMVARSYHHALGEAGVPARVVTPWCPGGGEAPDVLRYASLPFAHPYRMGLSFDPVVRRALDALPLAVAHAHSPFSAGELAERSARSRRIPLVFTLHTRYAEWGRHRYRGSPWFASVLGLDAWMQPPTPDRLRLRDLWAVTPDGEAYVTRAVARKVWRFAARCDLVLVSTPSARDELLAAGELVPGSAPPPIRVLRHGVRSLPGPSAADDELRASLPPEPVLLYVGQLADEKGLPLLLEAAARLAADHVPFHLVLVGEGHRRAAYEARAAELGLGARCTFTGLVADPARLAAWYRAASLFVFPSTFETQGLVVMEAASQARSTLGLRGAPGVSELVTDGLTGTLCDPDPGAFAAAARALLADPGRLRSLGERARRLVRTEADSAREVLALYAELAPAGFGPGARTS
jgi:1,2-diacylglycerol 3-alpha-glucosyltransferase